MASIRPIEVLITTTSDVKREIRFEQGFIIRFGTAAFAVGAVLGAAFSWIAGRL